MASFNNIVLLLAFQYLFYDCQASSLVLHEKRDHDTDFRSESRPVDGHALLHMRVALMENEQARSHAEDWLMDISDPDSPNYGRHWSQGQVIEAFQPDKETIDNVTAWLHENDILDFVQSNNKLWFAFDVPAAKVEEMLNTKYFESDIDNGDAEAFCNSYYLPAHLSSHIHYITPGVKGSITRRRIQRRQLFEPSAKADVSFDKRDASSNPTSLNDCSTHVTPACIQALYNFSSPDVKQAVSRNNSLGIAEFEKYELYYQGDLDKFYHRYAPNIPNGTSPMFRAIDGDIYPANAHNISNHEFTDGGEAELDIQAAIPIIYPQNTTVYAAEASVGTTAKGFDFLLDVFDSSYCKRSSSTECGGLKPPNVLSVSYGDSEYINPRAHLERQCREYLKLGLQGVSVIFCSQDEGVGGMSSNTTDACPNGRAPRVFAPDFPASCPWVTSVGATMIPLNGTVSGAEEVANWYNPSTLRPPYNGAYMGSSGGGFSLTFDVPGYQKDTLASYFKHHNPPYPYFENGNYTNNKGRYNRNGRGIPDLAAVGTNIMTYWIGTGFGGENGTSGATPIVAALFNRIVEERIRVGKGPLGFVNPVLYKHPEVFNDIVKGRNGFCTPEEGFQAVSGWDPATGLGTPNYPKLLDVFMSLP